MRALSMRKAWPWMVVVAMTATGAFFFNPLRVKSAYGEDRNAPTHSEALASVESLSAAFRTVAKDVKPAVVQITSRAMQKESADKNKNNRRGIDPEDLPEQLREFFKDFEDKGGTFSMPTPPPQARMGTGSGFIIDAEKGLILTNKHVVGDDGESDNDLRVTIPGVRRNLPAKVIGEDPKTDIALIQVEASHLKSLPLGDSSKMEVGDWVMAIGAPFGLEQTVTQGIISATGRSVSNDLPYQDWIQTDAAINPGNSGGPLVNMRGEVIGINVAIATSGVVAGYQGVGFAIPINVVKDILPDLREGHEVVRSYLGVQIQGLEVQPGLAETYGLKEGQQGVVVEDVQSGTPASRAGLKRDDVILMFNDHSPQNGQQLQDMVARTKPGTKVDLKVWREGKELVVPVTLEKQPANFFARKSTGGGGRDSRGERGRDEDTTEQIESLGMTVQEVTPALAKKFSLDEDTHGQVVVTEVKPLGEAAANGVAPGDIIISVQDKQIKSSAGLKKALNDEALEHGLRMQVRTRDGFHRTLFFELSPARPSRR